MSAEGTESQGTSESLGAPDHDRSGPTIEEAVAEAEEGSEVEGVHTVPGEVAPGESRGEQMRDVEGLTEAGSVDAGDTRATAPTPEPGPSPTEVGSGGAQRVVGARIPDRASAGEDVPDGPPFDDEPAGGPAGEPRDDEG